MILKIVDISMSSINRTQQFSNRYYLILIVFLFCCLLSGCQNFSVPDVTNMLRTFDLSIDGLWSLATAAGRLIGMAFIMRGVYQLKVYGDLRTMMSTQTNLKSTLVMFFVGVALMFSTNMLQTMMLTTFGYASPLEIRGVENKYFSAESMRVILHFVQFIGLVAFIRGWIYLTQSQNSGGHHTFGKSLTHIFGGILAINIQGTSNVLKASFGIATG